ncbi:MAG TPA: SNF2 helicase associated domain-containing protein [Clostridiaceae bacterium]|nr:SNF2 helicase associated domain-containing protein [Clostridiaceae bacterium]
MPNKETHRAFNQLLNTFLEINNKEEELAQDGTSSIKLVPIFLYNDTDKKLKVEFKIGNKQLTKINNLPDFFERMLNREKYKYNNVLEFIHEENAFKEQSRPLLKFLLKYAEIIKYASDVNNNYAYYGRNFNVNNVVLSNTGLDELFEILKGKTVEFETKTGERKIQFIDEPIDIKFILEKSDESTYCLTPNIDVYGYDIFYGKNYSYFLIDNKMHKCLPKVENRNLELLEVYKKNYTQSIVFNENNLRNFFAIVVPKIKDNFEIKNIDKEQIEKYMPKDLYVKIYLDYNEKGYIIADVKFCYGNVEFNPIKNVNLEITRNAIQENEVIDTFVQTGFMLDSANARLVLANDEKIYNFLSKEIEDYMKKFEVLVAEDFKKKDIKKIKIKSIGVKIENNLLDINLEDFKFNIYEIKDIINKYKLRKKFYRLKDGTYISLEKNSSLDFLENLTDNIEIEDEDVEENSIKLPIYRALYLEKIFKNMPNTNIQKNEYYKNMISQIEDRQIDLSTKIPPKLNAELRTYQKIGYKWLRTLEQYKMGGILADDMGLGKTIQLLAVILSYVQKNKGNVKPSIIICPSSLALNWYNEIQKFTPTLKALVISDDYLERKRKIEEIGKYQVIITSYDSLKRDIDLYENYCFKYVVADEAQYIKNNNTKNSKAIKTINAETKFALTGTPIENSLSELWSIFDFIMPGYLYKYKKFKELYETPIIKEQNEDVMNKLKKQIEPFVLRRTKGEVLTELPDKTVTILNNEMSEEQYNIYMSYMAQARKEIMSQIDINGFEKSQIKILSLLMRLRQICCHPKLFLREYEGESSKLNQCIEIIQDAVLGGHKILLFSSYTSMFEIIEEKLKNIGVKYLKLTGQTKVGERIELVDKFNTDENIKVFLISLKAGGTGLNLTGADMVIHYDPWWNLSAENQATDRTYRIGQKRNVQVYKLITKNSIEEKIYELQQKKAKLIDNMLSTDATFINKLSKDDILALFE